MEEVLLEPVIAPLGLDGRVAVHEHVWPLLDALAGNATTRVVSYASLLTRAGRGALGAVQRHSVGSILPLHHFFFLCIGLPSQHDQDGVSQQRKRYMPVPGAKAPHFILIKPNLSFGLLIAFFNPPPTSSYSHQFGQ